MGGAKKIIKNSSWMASEQFVRLVAGLFVGVWIARHLGPSDFGALNLALALSSLVGVFATLGLSRTVVRELALHDDNNIYAQRVVASTIVWRIFFSFLCYVVTLAVSLAFGQGDPLLVSIVAASVGFSSFDVIDLYFQSRSISSYCILARSINFFFFLCVKAALLFSDAGVFHFAVITTLEAMGSALALWWSMLSFGIKPTTRDVDIRYGWRLIIQSWPELFAGLAALVLVRIDQIMLGQMVGQEAVGQYAVASRIAEVWYFIPSALVASSFPDIVKVRKKSGVLYMSSIHKLMMVTVGISYSAAVSITLIAPWAVSYFFGQSYSNSAAILVILVWSGLFVSLGTSSGSWIMAEGRPMLSLKRNVLGAVANIAFNFYLIPCYGGIGAALGTLASLSIAYFLSDFINPETRHIGLLKLKSLFFIH